MAKQSTARQQSLDFLNDLGTDKSDYRDVITGLEKVCGAFINRVVVNINQNDMVDKGNISDISMSIISNNELEIIGQQYINYIDKGVQGSISNNLAPNSPYKYTDSMPPPAIFEDWIKSKNIKVRNTKDKTGSGKDKVFDLDSKDEIKKAAYAIALNRYNNGVAPVPIFSKEIEQLVTDASNIVGTITISNIISNLDL